MSLNPVLVKSSSEDLLMPQLRESEAYVLSRPFVHIKVITPNEVLKGKGHIVMTTQRIVFVKLRDKNFSKRYSSISLPFILISRPIFNQPVFIPNNLQANILPDTDETYQFSGESQFNIYFHHGGANMFLHHFFIHFARNKNNPTNNRLSRNTSLTSMSHSGAIVDLADPTKIFVTQPDTTPIEQDDADKKLEAHDKENPLLLPLFNLKRFFK